MDLAIQIIANDKTIRSDTVEDLKEFDNQPLATQAKEGKQLVSMMPAIRKAFDLLDDDIIELSTENDALKDRKVSYDEKCLEECKLKLLKQIDDGKRAFINLSMLKTQINQN